MALKQDTAARAFTVIKGGAEPLSDPQRRLVGVFIEFLSMLPEWDDEKKWREQAYEYSLLNKLMYVVFKKKFGEPKDNDVSYWPKGIAEEYEELLSNARTRPNPVTERRMKMLEVAHAKRRLVDCAKFYVEDRQEAGLTPDLIVTEMLRSFGVPTEGA